MNLSLKATGWSVLVSIVQGIGIVYITTSPQPQSWNEFASVKFVMALVLLLGGNTPLAHKSFRDPNTRTRNSDSYVNNPVSFQEVLDKRNKK